MSLVNIGVYLRISDDRDGEQTATERQLEDCNRFAAGQGWNVADVFEDVDLSAYQKTVKRPEFERMLTAVRDRQIGGVLAWKLDRLARRQRDFVRLDEQCEESGAFIATIVDGINTGNATGRMVAEILTTIARQESQNSSTRIKRSHEAMAKAGKASAGGTRAFGYTVNRAGTIPEEVQLIRKAANRVLSGDSIRGVCFDWEKRGVLSPAGKTWKQGPLRRLLTNPMLSAQRVYEGSVTAGTWPAILTTEETARLRLLLLDPARRKTTGNSRSYLLSGFLRCGHCDATLIARPRQDKSRRYVCARRPGYEACGKLARMAEPIEDIVTEMLFSALEDADLSGYLRGRQRQDMRLLEESIRADVWALEGLTQDHYVNRIIDRGEFLSARSSIEERLRDNRRRTAEDREQSVLGVLMAGAELRKIWPGKPLDWKRSVLGIIIDHVTIMPAVKGRNVFDPSLVEPIWRA